VSENATAMPAPEPGKQTEGQLAEVIAARLQPLIDKILDPRNWQRPEGPATDAPI
jgi:hypothetical protein